MTNMIITPNVTVFIPPAVLAGEPPTNIRQTDNNLDTEVNSFCGIVANPAVLSVVD